MTDQAPELLRQFLSRDPRVVFTGNMLDAARDEIERLRALTRPPSERPSEAALAWRGKLQSIDRAAYRVREWATIEGPYTEIIKEAAIIRARVEQILAIPHEEAGRVGTKQP